MHATRALPALITALALLMSCGGDDDTTDGESTTTAPAAVTSTTATVATTSQATTTTGTTTSEPVRLEQPAVWPAADVVFETPEEAAADFVTQVLGVGPVLGEFQQGDARSGEIEVFSPGEDDTPVARGLLLMRQLGPEDGWFVLAAVNDHASISSPESMAVVPAAPLTVEGSARGFEANVVVTAFVARDAGAVLDSVTTEGGAADTAEPFSVTLDLTGAAPGEVVALLVQGGAGLETDPGDFGAGPVVIEG